MYTIAPFMGYVEMYVVCCPHSLWLTMICAVSANSVVPKQT